MSEKYYDKAIWGNKFFPNQLNNKEDILMVLRQDIVFLVFQFMSFLLVFLVATLAKSVLSDPFSKLGPAKYTLDIIYNTLNIILIAGFLIRFHDYYLSIQIVTDQRIIDISQKGLFGREVNELQFDKIEDVTHKQNGLLATMFNFGDIVIQTASAGSANTSGFVFKNIPNPSKAHKIIMDVTFKRASDSQTVFINNVQSAQKAAQPNQNNNPNTNINPNYINPNQNIANPLPVNYRENVLNTSENLDNTQN